MIGNGDTISSGVVSFKGHRNMLKDGKCDWLAKYKPTKHLVNRYKWHSVDTEPGLSRGMVVVHNKHKFTIFSYTKSTSVFHSISGCHYRAPSGGFSAFFLLGLFLIIDSMRVSSVPMIPLFFSFFSILLFLIFCFSNLTSAWKAGVVTIVLQGNHWHWGYPHAANEKKTLMKKSEPPEGAR